MTDERDDRDDAELSSPQLHERQVSLRTLTKHPGWLLLTRFAERQQLGYQRQALMPVKSIDDVPGNEYVKGVAQGITEVLTLPAQLIEALETELSGRAKRVDAGTHTDDDYDDGAENG